MSTTKYLSPLFYLLFFLLLVVNTNGCEISSLRSSAKDRPWVIHFDPDKSVEAKERLPPYHWVSVSVPKPCMTPEITVTCPQCEQENITYDAESNSLRIPKTIERDFEGSLEAVWSNGVQAESLDFIILVNRQEITGSSRMLGKDQAIPETGPERKLQSSCVTVGASNIETLVSSFAYEYEMLEGTAAVLTLSSYSPFPDCSVTPKVFLTYSDSLLGTYSSVTDLSFLTYTSTQMTIATANYLLGGSTYYIKQTTAYGGDLTLEATVAVTFTDTCLTTILSSDSSVDQYVLVGGNTVTYTPTALYDSINLTYGKKGSATSVCGESSLTSTLPSYMTYKGGSFSISTTDELLAGVQQVNLDYTMDRYKTISATSTVDIFFVVLSAPASMSDETYAVLAKTKTISVNPFTINESLNFTISYATPSLSSGTGKLPSFISYTDNTPISLDFDVYTDAVTNIGIYEIEITATAVRKSDISDTVQKTYTFKVEVTEADICSTTTFNESYLEFIPNTIFVLLGTEKVFTNPWLDDSANTSGSSPSDCGLQTVTVDIASASFITITPDATEWDVVTILTSDTDTALVGSNMATLTWTLDNYSTITATKTVEIIFVEVVPPTDIGAQTYTIFDSELIFEVPLFTINPITAELEYSLSYSYELDNGDKIPTNWMNVPIESKVISFTIFSWDINDAGVTMPIAITIACHAENTNGEFIDVEYSFDVTLMDPCASTFFQSKSTVQSSLTLLISASKTVTLFWFNDFVNSYHGPDTTPSICGDQTVTVAWTDASNTDAISDFVTVVGGVDEVDSLTISTSDATYAGTTHSVTITWTLDNFSTITSSQEISVTFVGPYPVSGTLAAFSIADQTYEIYDTTLTVPILLFETIPSSQAYSFTISYEMFMSDGATAAPKWITFDFGNTRDYQISSSSMSDVVSAQGLMYRVTATDNTDSSTYTLDFTFSVTMTDPCLSTSLAILGTQIISAISLEVTEIATNSLFYVWDSVNQAANGGSTVPSVCGAQSVTVVVVDSNSIAVTGLVTITESLNSDEVDTFTVTTSDTSLIGTHTATFIWSFDDASYTATDSLDVIITISAQVLTVHPDLIYPVTEATTTVIMNSVFCLVSCSMTVSPSASFITFDSVIGTVSIYSIDNSDAGVYTVAVDGTKQTFAMDGTLNSETITTSWQVTVNEHLCAEQVSVVTVSANSIVAQSYYLLDAIASLDINIFTEDCDYCTSTDIVYTHTIQADASQDTTFISFDATARQMSWYASEVSNVGEYAISLVGTINTNNGISSYYNDASFVLSVTEAPTLSDTTSLSIDSDLTYSYSYETSSIMTSKQYQIYRSPFDTSAGTISLKVGGLTDEDSIESFYGITVTQATSSDGSSTILFVTSLYFDSDLENQDIDIEISYAIDGQDDLSITLSTITATYTSPVTNSNPYLKEELSEPALIPCFTDLSASKWEYPIPLAVSDLGNDITYGFSSAVLADFIIFDSSTRTLKLNLDPDTTIATNLSGEFTGSLILFDTESNSQQFDITFNFACSDNGGNSSSVETSSFAQEEEAWKILAKLKASLSGEEWVEPIDPAPKFHGIDKFGVIQLMLNQPMFTGFSATGLDPNTQTGTRRLQDDDDTHSNFINVEMIQNSEEELVQSQKLSYTYGTVWYNSTLQLVTLSFQRPEYVSQSTDEKDQIRITFNDTSAFASEKYPLLHITSDLNMTIDLPRQYPIGGTFHVNIEQMKNAAQVAVNAGFIMSFLLSAFLNQILSFVENLCVIIHMFIFKLNYPINLQDFMAGLFPLITFDAIPTEQLYDWMFDLSSFEDAAMRESDYFDSVGYGASLTISNMGSMFIMMLLTPTIAVFCWLLSCCKICGRPGKWIHKKSRGYLDGLFYNGIIGSIDAGYLVLTIIALIQIYNPRIGEEYSYSENFCTYIGIWVFSINASFPFVIALLYYCKMKRGDPLPDLTDDMQLEELRLNYNTIDIVQIQKTAYTESKHVEFMGKYGKLLEEIHTEKLGKNLSIMTAFVYVFRKFAVAFTVVTVEHPVFNIYMFNFTSLFVLMWTIYLHPFRSKTFQRIRVIQELVTMGINYHLFCFTDWVAIERRAQIGDSVIYILILQTAFFILWSMVPLTHSMNLYCKRKSLRKKAKVAARRKKQDEQYETKAALQPATKLIIDQNQERAFEGNNAAVKNIPNELDETKILECPTSELVALNANASIDDADLLIEMNKAVLAAIQTLQELPEVSDYTVYPITPVLSQNRSGMGNTGRVVFLPQQMRKQQQQHHRSKNVANVMQASLNTISEVGSFRENNTQQDFNATNQALKKDSPSILDKSDQIEVEHELNN